jgi:hypothetical protein
MSRSKGNSQSVHLRQASSINYTQNRVLLPVSGGWPESHALLPNLRQLESTIFLIELIKSELGRTLNMRGSSNPLVEVVSLRLEIGLSCRVWQAVSWRP